MSPSAEGTPPECHDRQFRGTFAPAILHDLVESKGLPVLAAWLAMVIDSLSKGSKGCFASNAFLAKKIGKKERNVRILLEKLEKANLLGSRWEGKKRFLWINYDGVIERRTDNYKAVDKETDTRPANNCHSDSEAAKTCRSERQDFAGLYHYNGLVDVEEYSRPQAAGERASLFPNGNGHTPNGNGTVSWATQMAHLLHDGLDKKGKLTKQKHNLRSWADSFADLVVNLKNKEKLSESQAREKVKAILQDHLAHLKDQYQPQLLSAKSFSEQFHRAEAAANRRGVETDYSPGSVEVLLPNGRIATRIRYREGDL